MHNRTGFRTLTLTLPSAQRRRARATRPLRNREVRERNRAAGGRRQGNGIRRSASISNGGRNSRIRLVGARPSLVLVQFALVAGHPLIAFDLPPSTLLACQGGPTAFSGHLGRRSARVRGRVRVHVAAEKSDVVTGFSEIDKVGQCSDNAEERLIARKRAKFISGGRKRKRKKKQTRRTEISRQSDKISPSANSKYSLVTRRVISHLPALLFYLPPFSGSSHTDKTNMMQLDDWALKCRRLQGISRNLLTGYHVLVWARSMGPTWKVFINFIVFRKPRFASYPRFRGLIKRTV